MLRCSGTTFSSTTEVVHSSVSFNPGQEPDAINSNCNGLQSDGDSGLLGMELKPLISLKTMDLQGVMTLCHYIQNQNSAERLKVNSSISHYPAALAGSSYSCCDSLQ